MPKILSNFLSFLLDIAEVVFLAFGLYLLLNWFVFNLHNVDGDSMLPTLHNKEYLITNKIVNRTGYKRGDIIIFKYPKMPSKEFVKRLIGFPKEKIQIINSKVIIYNDEFPEGFTLKEDYLAKDTLTTQNTFLKEGVIMEIPENNFFVMGDNREVSSDSRQWGFVPKENMVGQAVLRIWPVRDFGKLSRIQY
ncbi:MAG: signal peptidase I [bacterium]